MKHFVILFWLATMGTWAMANDPSTIRICDASGCSERAKNSATFQVEPEDPLVVQQRESLIALAEKDPRAAWDLGLRFFRGDGIKRDAYQALHWMRSAGERGNVEAQLAVGRFYLMGLEEMGSDPREAENWLQMAAGNGNKEAAKLLEQAKKASASEQESYQWREKYRKSWSGYWYTRYVYHGSWGPRGWYYR